MSSAPFTKLSSKPPSRMNSSRRMAQQAPVMAWTVVYGLLLRSTRWAMVAVELM